MRILSAAACFLVAGFIAGSSCLAAISPPEPALRLIAALQGSSEDRKTFVENFFSKSALQREGASDRAAALDKLVARAGGLSLVEAQAIDQRQTNLVLASPKGRFARAVLFLAKDDSHRLSNLFFLPARDPAKVAREAWPDHAIPAADLPHEIETRLAAQAADGYFAGAALVGKGDTPVVRSAYGFANRETRTLNAPDTRFHSASIGKMFTSVALLTLVADGTVSLDDSLAKWVPEFPDRAAAEKITLRQLLTHTAGLGEWSHQFENHESERAAARQMTDVVAAAPQGAMAYSNAGYVLLGAVIEAATGTTFDAALKARVFDPAGMTKTTLDRQGSTATPYRFADDDPAGLGGVIPEDKFGRFKGNGSGGAYTTVDDLFAFHRALIKGKLLPPALTHDVLTSLVDFPGTPRVSRYGLGFRFSACSGREVFGHSGGGANSGISNATYATTDGEWTVIVLSNSDGTGEEAALSLCDAVARR